jgi:hypothetical protein
MTVHGAKGLEADYAVVVNVVGARACPWCGAPAFVPNGPNYRCAAEKCGKTAPVCPEGKIGAVIPREGKFGPFLGCTEWRKEGPSCDYTRSSGQRRRQRR